MNLRTPRWTITVAASALLILPPTAGAQTPATEQKPTPSAQASQPADSPQAHLQKAEAALNEIPATAVTGSAKGKINELKQHLTALNRAASSTDKRTNAASGTAQWSKDVAAIDKTLNELLGSSATPSPTGTSGGSKDAPALDETTRAKLAEVRTHVTAFAAAMNKTSSPSDAAASASAEQPPAAAAQPPTSSSQPPSATAQPPATSTQPPATSSQPPATSAQPPATPPSAAAEPPSAASQQTPQGQPDEDAAKKHLTASRESLSQLTQLPAASQLQGEARAQVSQLITNFNELITTGANWRASYAKVEANVNALLGTQTTDESPTTPATGTAGAVGTSGTASGTLDPAIKAKLVEFRNHLKEFEKAAGGSAAASPSTAAAPTSSATTGSTTASTTASTASEPPKPEKPEAESTSSMSKDEAMKHIQAIEAILSANAGASANPTATAGTTGTSAAAAGLVLDKAQVEQLKSHIAELRRLIDQKN
jgi:hypothetical protein